MKIETGLTKPALILGLNSLCSLGVSLCMMTDIMHLAGNISNLLISLWCGDMKVGPNDDKFTWKWAVLRYKHLWASHGRDVATAGTFLPGSYDHKPCNIAEKINTQYKTWEFQLYMFSITPILLYDILPSKYWSHFCQLMHGFQIVCQHSLIHQQLENAHCYDSPILCVSFLISPLDHRHLLGHTQWLPCTTSITLFPFFDHFLYKCLSFTCPYVPLSDIFSHELWVYKLSTIVFTNLTLVLLKLSSLFGASSLGSL